MMRKLFTSLCVLTFCVLAFCSCSTLSHLEKREYKSLEMQGISLKHPAGDYKAPNSAWLAALLNLLPGFGNFYLACGSGNDGTQAIYGAINLLLWPISSIWSIPEAAYDAIQLNKSDMLYYYRYSPDGQQELQNRGVKFP